MKFKYGDDVVVKSGFYEGLKGKVTSKLLYTYCVQLEDLTSIWLYPFQIQKL